MITLSIVSHGQGDLVAMLLKDLVNFEEITSIILTKNIPESLPSIPDLLQATVIVIENVSAKGFGENHNAAFSGCNTPFFCVVNPDVRMPQNPFPQLIESLAQNNVAMCAPLIVNSKKHIEDSIRLFPTPARLLKRILTGEHATYKEKSKVTFPNWVAGMFMLFDSKAFQALDGFDERYFLYYEDVDICARLWKANLRLFVNQHVSVVHNAQRTSHKKIKYLRWHLTSMCRFFIYHLYNLPNPNPQTGLLIRD